MPLNLSSLARDRIVFFDCGLGTTLHALSLAAGERPEVWNITKPEALINFHRQCLEAGSEIVSANTFGANAIHFPPGGEYALCDLIFAAVATAKEAIRLAGREGSAWVAFDVGSTGRLLAPFGDLAFENAVAIFREGASIAMEAGADLILMETMSDTQETRAAVLGAKEGAPGLPFAAAMTFEENGRLLTGGTPLTALAAMEALGIQAFGVNCGAGPERALRVLPEILRHAHVPVIAQPNAGLPRVVDGHSVFDLTPEAFAEQCEAIFGLGTALLGGCCGTTPAHIAALYARLQGKKTLPPQGDGSVIICSARKILILGDAAPETGLLDAGIVADAFHSGTWEDLCDAAVDLECDGAELLALPLPADAEPGRAGEMVEQLQSATQLPLCFVYDGNASALEAALRHYNGVALMEHKDENGRQAVQALAERYGAVVR